MIQNFLSRREFFVSIGENAFSYGFNGQEKDNEVGAENYTAEFWEYDSRLGRRWNIDPVVNYSFSPYATFSNSPIGVADPKGADPTKGIGNVNSSASTATASATKNTYQPGSGIVQKGKTISNQTAKASTTIINTSLTSSIGTSATTGAGTQTASTTNTDAATLAPTSTSNSYTWSPSDPSQPVVDQRAVNTNPACPTCPDQIPPPPGADPNPWNGFWEVSTDLQAGPVAGSDISHLLGAQIDAGSLQVFNQTINSEGDNLVTGILADGDIYHITQQVQFADVAGVTWQRTFDVYKSNLAVVSGSTQNVISGGVAIFSYERVFDDNWNTISRFMGVDLSYTGGAVISGGVDIKLGLKRNH